MFIQLFLDHSTIIYLMIKLEFKIVKIFDFGLDLHMDFISSFEYFDFDIILG